LRLSSRSECGQSNRRKSREAVITQAPWLQSERKREAKRDRENGGNYGEKVEREETGREAEKKSHI
jgi:hypothetical protein